MWISSIGIIVELILLSFIAKQLTQTLFILFLRLFHSRSVAITIITMMLFPGTVVHELSHLFTAEVFGVHTGKLTLAPESIEGEDIQSGSVSIATTDPFRRTLIGIAPTMNGTIALTALSWWLMNVVQYHQYIIMNTQVSIGIIFYLILTITNTMFTSKEDMKGVLPVFLTLILILAGLYMAGIQVGIPQSIIKNIQNISWVLFQNLGIVLGINLVSLALFSGILLLTTKHR